MIRRSLPLVVLLAALAVLPVAAGGTAAPAQAPVARAAQAAPPEATGPAGTCTGESTAAAADLPLFAEEPNAAAACSATAQCKGGTQLACSDPGGWCSGVNGCYVVCGCEVTWCPKPSGPLGMPCPRPITCGGT
jgi:hypothetical protein